MDVAIRQEYGPIHMKRRPDMRDKLLISPTAEGRILLPWANDEMEMHLPKSGNTIVCEDEHGSCNNELLGRYVK